MKNPPSTVIRENDIGDLNATVRLSPCKPRDPSHQAVVESPSKASAAPNVLCLYVRLELAVALWIFDAGIGRSVGSGDGAGGGGATLGEGAGGGAR